MRLGNTKSFGRISYSLPTAPVSISAISPERHAHKKARWFQQASSNGVTTTLSTHEVVGSTTRERDGKNLEGRQDHNKVVLNGNGKSKSGQREALEDNKQWQETGFPSYLQSGKDDFCKNWEEAMQDVERKSSQQGVSRISAVTSSNPVWRTMRKEAGRDAQNEPLLSSFLYASILSHDNFLECLAFVLANRLSDPTMLATEYFETFLSVFHENVEIVQAALDDIQAVRERDPACGSYSNALLFYKGYQAIQVHRIAHHLWNLGQNISARNLQSRVSEVFAMDIHPQAKFGKGILMDHGTGIVVGQTAVVGNNVSILQNVTLGGTGKSDGDRHPKISDNVLVGAGATILGNITIGKGAMVAAGSLVLKPVPSKTMVAGSPAKEVGKMTGNPALKMQHWLKSINLESDPFCEPFEDMLQSKTQEQPDNKPVSVTTARKSQEESQVATPPKNSADVDNARPTSMPELPEESTSGKPAEQLATDVQNAQAALVSEGRIGHPSLANGRPINGKATSGLHPGPSPEQRQVRESRGPGEGGADHQSSPGQQQNAKGNEGPKEKPAAVLGVRSDEEAKKLWPQAPEPEYYL